MDGRLRAVKVIAVDERIAVVVDPVVADLRGTVPARRMVVAIIVITVDKQVAIIVDRVGAVLFEKRRTGEVV